MVQKMKFSDVPAGSLFYIDEKTKKEGFWLKCKIIPNLIRFNAVCLFGRQPVGRSLDFRDSDEVWYFMNVKEFMSFTHTTSEFLYRLKHRILSKKKRRKRGIHSKK